MAAANTVIDKVRFTGTAAAAGGTFTCDYAVPTDRKVRVTAYATLTAQTGAPAHLTKATDLVASYTVRSNNGALAALTAYTGGQNPANSASVGNIDASAQGDEFFGGTVASANWTISGTNVRLTVTNQHATQAADVTVIVDAIVTG